MPRITVRRHGCSASIPKASSQIGNRRPEQRKANRGWTLAVARRNAQFLQRIDFSVVRGRPYAVTLTLPVRSMHQVTPELLHRFIDIMLKYLGRRGLLNFHWVIEFTASHMPHIHMTVWMADTYERWDAESRRHVTVENDLTAVTGNVVGKWLALAAEHSIRASGRSQDVEPLDGSEAWLAYVAKHTQRGIYHYQRSLKNMPAEWKDNPGAMWGHSRHIPLSDDAKMPADSRAFHQFRREVRKWCCARAVRISDPQRRAKSIRQARHINRCTDPALSSVRPLSVWIPREVAAAIIRGLRSRGYMIGPDVYQWAVEEEQRLRESGEDPQRLRAIQRCLSEMMRS